MKKENNILEQIGKKNPYKVPENYFEDFANNMDKLIDSMPIEACRYSRAKNCKILGTASKKSRNDGLRCANHQELW